MPAKILRKFLDENNIKYINIDHSPAYTAREVAASAFVPRREFAKSIIVDLDGETAMAVVSASRHVDLDALAELAGVSVARLATESEFQEVFTDCEVGAMPPFGNLYGVRVFLDQMVRDVDDVCFNAGSHIQILRMECDDYVRLVEPVVGEFAVKK